ncbi:DUF4157 domain-containing protein [Granulicella sp. WH15]|uniref:eCIS core domain-containing protein n=1 Tax=Granulicella sp. WH15 TaxID=2602070 RepID=UPI0013674314|nr:DUF4157 domain-containing protein [Granulicella sp. WH15]QHN04111.1 DUF4157 domain-containing protein [Granulicella sp. WH15]
MEFASAERKPAARTTPAQLRVGPVQDALEMEAERVADAVMASAPPSFPSSPGGGGAPMIRRCACGSPARGEECETCRKARRKSEGKVQREADGQAYPEFAPPLVHHVLATSGNPLDGSARPFLEGRFGFDFSRIRIHNDARAHQSAEGIGANAYTAGDHIVFARGRYAPETWAGRRLLAHELAHTVQQRRGEAKSVQRQPTPPPIHADADFSANVTRLEEIIRTGGPVPGETRVIASAIIDVEGYTGPREMRAISGAATDALGQGAPVYHAHSPAGGPGAATSATRSIAGAGSRREFPFSHINDAERKIFEDLAGRLPENARGTVHFLTERVRQVNGQTVFEPIPACSGCTQATFQMGSFRGVNFVSHAATHPTPTLDLGKGPENKVNPPPETKPKAEPESTKALGEAEGGVGTKALGEAEGGLGTKALADSEGLEGGLGAAAGEEAAAADAALGTRALGKAGGIAVGIALIAGWVLWEITVEPKLQKLRDTVEGYKDERRKEFMAKIQQDFQKQGSERVGLILKSCWLQRLREKEKEGKKSYVHVSLKVTYRDNRIFFTHGDPEAPLDLDYAGSEVVGVSVDQTVQGASLEPLVHSDEKSFMTASKVFWTQILHFSFEAPTTAAIEKEFGKADDVLNCQSGACFIATACYGTSSVPQLDTLRSFRDGVLARSRAGRALVRFYYRNSTPVALYLWKHSAARRTVRYGLVAPLVLLVRVCGAGGAGQQL